MFGITGIVLAFILINRMSEEVLALDIALLYTQVVSIIQQFDLYWPPPVDVLNTPYQVTDFDMDFLSPECVSSWSYTAHFGVQFALPFIIVGANLVINILAYAWYRLSEREERLTRERRGTERIDGVMAWLMSPRGGGSGGGGAYSRDGNSAGGLKQVASRFFFSTSP